MRLHSLKRFKFIFFVLQRVLGLTSRFVICPPFLILFHHIQVLIGFQRVQRSRTIHPVLDTLVTHTHTADVKNELISLSNLITKFWEDYVTGLQTVQTCLGSLQSYSYPPHVLLPMERRNGSSNSQ